MQISIRLTVARHRRAAARGCGGSAATTSQPATTAPTLATLDVVRTGGFAANRRELHLRPGDPAPRGRAGGARRAAARQLGSTNPAAADAFTYSVTAVMSDGTTATCRSTRAKVPGDLQKLDTWLGTRSDRARRCTTRPRCARPTRRRSRPACPGTQLMAAAGEAVAHVVRVRYPSARRVVCVCGGGANGGDGLVAARRLRALGVDASCLVVASRPYEGDALDACEAAVAAGVPVSRVGAVGDGLRGADVVVDALLGTGRSGEPRGAVAEAIRAIGAPACRWWRSTSPSGVDASTGEVAAVAVTADVTVTFHAPKIGHVILPGLRPRRRAGGGADRDPGGRRGAGARHAGGRGHHRGAAGARQPFGSKYDAGNVLAIGGSRGMTGAIVLCSRAALRAGAGLVVAAVPASQQPVVAGLALEPMTLACADAQDGGLAPDAADLLLERAARAAAVALGPGCGRAPAARRPRAAARAADRRRRWCWTPTGCTRRHRPRPARRPQPRRP